VVYERAVCLGIRIGRICRYMFYIFGLFWFGMRLGRWVVCFVVVLVLLVFGLWLVRAVLPSQIDDVNPLMGCSVDELEMADVYFVVPVYDGVEIDGEWCEGILGKGKEVALHGVYHSYEEFGVGRDREYLDYGVGVFKECFGFAPERFKPPQIAWDSENDWIRGVLDVELFWNQVFHKVYHCGDSGVFPNWVIGVF
jgi:hypothetical protein